MEDTEIKDHAAPALVVDENDELVGTEEPKEEA